MPVGNDAIVLGHVRRGSGWRVFVLMFLAPTRSGTLRAPRQPFGIRSSFLFVGHFALLSSSWKKLPCPRQRKSSTRAWQRRRCLEGTQYWTDASGLVAAWLARQVAGPRANPATSLDSFQPITVGPGQTAPIPVTITPAGASGTKVTGTLYLDDTAYFEFGSIQDALVNFPQADEVAALPYPYTIK
jgi:hypothetical protein